MSQQTSGQTAAPGQFFDVPGIGGGTQWTDQYDSTVSLSTTLSQQAQVPVNGIIQFRQTDVVVDWLLEVAVSQTYTAGTSTLTTSPYAPWNQLGPIKLPIQNQYNSVDVENGIDLYIFNLIRPYRKFSHNNQYAAPLGSWAGGTAQGYEAIANAQPNLIVPSQWTTATTSWTQQLRIPASITLDVYYDLAITGEPTGTPPHSAIVSPQYMAGSTRVITPTITANPGSGATLDIGPVNIGSGTGSFAGTLTTSIRRKAIYSADPALLPPVYGWQYRWRTTRFNLNGVSTRQLQLPLDTGQILSVYIRMFDPSANSGLGAPIAFNNSVMTQVQLQYGSGLYWFNGTPAELQAQWMELHNQLLPPGVFAFDLCLDEAGRKTNKRCLNTLTTSGIVVSMSFAAATSSTAYAVMGTESLVYVA
jgi:hypothetical protein